MSYIFGLFWWAGSIAPYYVTNGVKLARDDEEVARAVGGGVDLQLYTAGLLIVVYGMFLLVCTAAGNMAAKKISGWSRDRRIEKGIQRRIAESAEGPVRVDKCRAIVADGAADPEVLQLARAVVDAADAGRAPGTSTAG